MFFKMHENVKFDEGFLYKWAIDGYMRVPLTSEDPKIKIPKEIITSMMNVLDNMPRNEKPSDLEAVKQFMDLCDANEELFSQDKLKITDLDNKIF